MSESKEFTQALNVVLNNILKSDDMEAREAGKSLLEIVPDAISALKVGDVEQFDILLAYPLRKMIRGAVATEYLSAQAEFLFTEYQFVERHFVAIIERFEGSACSAHKSRAIIRRLCRFFRDNQEIGWDWNQKYTFHIPVKVFKTHAEIIAFFDAIRRLYYGQSEAYLKALKDMIDANSPA